MLFPDRKISTNKSLFFVMNWFSFTAQNMNSLKSVRCLRFIFCLQLPILYTSLVAALLASRPLSVQSNTSLVLPTQRYILGILLSKCARQCEAWWCSSCCSSSSTAPPARSGRRPQQGEDKTYWNLHFSHFEFKDSKIFSILISSRIFPDRALASHFSYQQLPTYIAIIFNERGLFVTKDFVQFVPTDQLSASQLISRSFLKKKRSISSLENFLAFLNMIFFRNLESSHQTDIV